jgi:hypothetical protein
MNSTTRRLIRIVAIAIVAVVLVWLWPWESSAPTVPQVEQPLSPPAHATDPATFGAGAVVSPAVLELPGRADAVSVRQWMGDWQERLRLLPRDRAVAELCELLGSGWDAPTGLGFKVGVGGFLEETPTFRVWLLDELSRIDPAAAAREARAILDVSESPDEWAVALRICARADGTEAGQAWVREQARELIRREAWLESPSTGLLEAFDLFVYTRDVEAVPELAALIRRKENRAVAHAAYLAVDRLILASPGAVLEVLVEHPALLEGRETTRGNYVARADVSDAGQRRLVEEYLLDPRRSWEELEAFAGVFPNANFMISNNLVTSNITLSGVELRRRDLAAAEVVREWSGDPRFDRLRPLLELLNRRLDEFVRQHRSAP